MAPIKESRVVRLQFRCPPELYQALKERTIRFERETGKRLTMEAALLAAVAYFTGVEIPEGVENGNQSN